MGEHVGSIAALHVAGWVVVAHPDFGIATRCESAAHSGRVAPYYLGEMTCFHREPRACEAVGVNLTVPAMSGLSGASAPHGREHSEIFAVACRWIVVKGAVGVSQPVGPPLGDLGEFA